MYLLVSDGYAIQQDREYFICSRDWLDRVKTCFPDYAKIETDAIEEILIYSARKSDDTMHVKRASCKGYYADEDSIKVEYVDMGELDICSGDIRKRRYGYCRNKGLIHNENEFPPSILFIDDVREYSWIKNGKTQFVINENLLSKLEGMVSSNDWFGILKSCPRADRIESDELWNDPECLGKLTLALSKLASRTYRNPSQEDMKRQKENEAYFFKVVERCIELEPYRSMHKSTLAYYLYDRYKKEHRQEDFVRAKGLYEDLVENSNNKFKEQYRYANLLRTHFMLPDNYYNSEAYKEFNKIINEYQILIDSYGNLNDQEQKAQRNNYIKGLYQFVVLHADRTFTRYWDVYFDKVFDGAEVPEYLLDIRGKNLISDCERKIDAAIELVPDEVTASNVNDKPGYFDVYYRKAQIVQSKGLVCILLGYAEDKCLKFFEESEEIVEKLLGTASALKGQGCRFTYPEYLKFTQAINLLFIHDERKLSRCFDREKPWMQFEHARICLVLGETENARVLLNGIPQKDLCRNKADKLLERLDTNK